MPGITYLSSETHDVYLSQPWMNQWLNERLNEWVYEWIAKKEKLLFVIVADFPVWQGVVLVGIFNI